MGLFCTCGTMMRGGVCPRRPRCSPRKVPAPADPMPVSNPRYPHNPWTDGENTQLRQLWKDGSVPLKDIAERLGRTQSSVKTRAKVLGLRREFARNRFQSGPTNPSAKRRSKSYERIPEALAKLDQTFSTAEVMKAFGSVAPEVKSDAFKRFWWRHFADYRVTVVAERKRGVASGRIWSKKAASKMAKARARAIELAKQVPPPTSFKIAELVRAEFGSRWPNSRRVHIWLVEAELEDVSRVGSIPRSHSKEAVLDAIRADKTQFERTGIPKYRNLNDLAAEMGIARTRLATEYKEALAYRTGPTNWALRHPRPKATGRRKADEEWGD